VDFAIVGKIAQTVFPTDYLPTRLTVVSMWIVSGNAYPQTHRFGLSLLSLNSSDAMQQLSNTFMVFAMIHYLGTFTASFGRVNFF
jgi:hypothetical protein